MDKLSNREQGFLHKIAEDNDLCLLFFQEVKELKWFDALYEEGYFAPENNPNPVPVEGTDYVNIPYWPAIDYLVKTSTELSKQEDDKYAKNFLQIIINVTKHAIENEFGNYKTWWQFSKILKNMPAQLIQESDLDVIDYWLKDEYGSNSVAEQVGTKWLISLLNNGDQHSLQLSKGLLDKLYHINFTENMDPGYPNEASFRFDRYFAQEITVKTATLAGEGLGEDAILIFDRQLKTILKEPNNDSWSYIWQPAIEDHKQNKYNDETENILIQAYRDSLDGYIKTKPREAYKYVEKMLGNGYQTIHRLAIHSISNNYIELKDLTDTLLSEKNFTDACRHEIWHFLNQNYINFTDTQKNKTLEIIGGISISDGDGACHEEVTAYNKLCWLAAIKSYGDEGKSLYAENFKITERNPDHPDFLNYIGSYPPTKHNSPFSINELGDLPVDDLVAKLSNYENVDHKYELEYFRGLSDTFKPLIKIQPRKFYLNLNKFANLDFPYIHAIIQSYNDLWIDKANLPWDDVWKKLLEFCQTVINNNKFWDNEAPQQQDSFIPNQDQVVSSMSQLIETGTKSDDHAFNEAYLEDARKIILHLLKKVKGNSFDANENAVTIATSSSRGRCLEALINLALRSCRLSDKEHDKDHSAVWKAFQSDFDTELNRSNAEPLEYEFATLVTFYLPNFLYMSKKWVLNNLDKIFDQSRDLKWSCAMQGYAYVNRTDPDIYQHLKNRGDFLKVLDDTNLKDNVKRKIIQDITRAFLGGFDDLSNKTSLMNTLIARNKYEEISYLIRFLRVPREDISKDLQEKVFELWPQILGNINLATDNGKKTISELCWWTAFIDKIESPQKKWLLKMARYSTDRHDGHNLLKNLARLSKDQPIKSQEIWLKMLNRPSYAADSEDAIKELLKNLIECDKEGEGKAEKIAGKYLKHGETQPQKWLEEIKDKTHVNH